MSGPDEAPRGGGVLVQCLGIGVPPRVRNPEPVWDKKRPKIHTLSRTDTFYFRILLRTNDRYILTTTIMHLALFKIQTLFRTDSPNITYRVQSREVRSKTIPCPSAHP